MRIIAGEYRGRRLTPLGKGDGAAHLRPTPDRVRESLFSALASRDVIEGAQVLDLFAGTGALGLEALSRGAAQVTFVDDGRVAQGLVRQNITLLDCADRARLIRRSAARLGSCQGARCDLVFLDPPYGRSLGAPALAAARAGGWLAEGALIVWEENAPMTAPEGFALLDGRRFGDTHVTFLEHEHDDA